MCPDSVDPVELEELVWTILDDAERRGIDLLVELEKRYAEELKKAARAKAVA